MSTPGCRSCFLFLIFLVALILLFETTYLERRPLSGLKKNLFSIFDDFSFSASNNSVVNVTTKIDLQTAIDTTKIDIDLEIDRVNKSNSTEPTIILAWTSYFGGSAWDKENDWQLSKDCAPELNCELTSDRHRFNESSAVLFLLRNSGFDDPTPVYRRSNQYFVFVFWESSANHGSGSMPKNFYNLTMTYRRDSDIFWPYRYFRKRPLDRRWSRREEETTKKIIDGKKKSVAWFVSHCSTSSKREKYVEQLRKYIKVDTYGSCGDLRCPRRSQSACDQMLANDYKFYLSFENSLCRDYVTEKYYDRLANGYVVPVVLKRNIISDLFAESDTEMLRAVNSSFIAVDDFPNIGQLADYLKYLERNKEAYAKYFEWRRRYEVMFIRDLKPGCELCRLIKKGKPNVIEDIEFWWSKKYPCQFSV